MELFKAHQNWANRPDDERFASVADYKADAVAQAAACKAYNVNLGEFRFLPGADGELLLSRNQDSNFAAKLSNWAFGQLAAKFGCPAGFLTTLSADTASRILHEKGLKDPESADAQIYYDHQNNMVRAVTSPKYSRVTDARVAEVAERLVEKGWAVPPAMTDGEKPSGLYRGDRDSFIFLVDEQNRIDDGSDGGLARGIFVENSEVGAAALALTCYQYRFVCGNHIVWGAQNVTEVRRIHMGVQIHQWANDVNRAVFQYRNAPASIEEKRIQLARNTVLGKDSDEVADRVAKMRIATRSLILNSLAAVIEDEDGNPRSAWGLAQGMTRLSQNEANADKRTEIDRAAGELLAKVTA